MKKGFTLLELIIVIIIIGILGSMGFVQYTRVVERGRSAEAKVLLGQVRKVQEGYRQEWGSYTSTMGNLAIDVPTTCTATHYFSYSSSTSTGTATRCSANGKSPQGPATPYVITVDYLAGSWGGSPGYY